MMKIGLMTMALLVLSGLSFAQTPLADGSHDFDFDFGTWHTVITRTADPFGGGTQTMKLEGTVTVRKIWEGRAQMEEIEADGPKGHWEGMSLFLYNPQSRQWSQNFINSRLAALEPPLIGSFRQGRGELFAQDSLDGVPIFVKATWFDISKDAHRYEEAYSKDGCKTWHMAFSAVLTRDLKAEEASPGRAVAPVDASMTDRQFDFDFGNWDTHTSRLLHPLTGATAWTPLDGSTKVSKVWGGRANIAEYKSSVPSGAVELLSLRWYNAHTHRWSMSFATSAGGTLGNPASGEFRDGRLNVFDQENLNNRSILVRFSIWSTGRDQGRSEQAFSVDGGQTWETNWINTYTRSSSRL